MFHHMETAERAADEIAKLYLKASRYISLESDQIFERFQKKHRLTESEARQLLNTLQDKTSIDDLKAVLRADPDHVSKAAILAELESPAYQARLERLQQLQNQLDRTMQEVYKQEKARNTSHYVDLANEAYYRSIFEIQQQTGLGFSFNLIDPAVIDKVINSKWSGANYSTRIWHNTQALAKDLKEELLMNLITGRTDREAAEIIANKYAQGASNARRLVRTESCNLATQMDMQSYEECGIEKYRFVATLDLRTSPPCRKLDGKVFLVSEQQPGKNCPPLHPWCRSTTICDIGDEELAQMKRRARDPVTGKTKTVPANMTYEQWHRQNVKGHPDAEQNERMWKNRHSDRRQYETYKTIYGEDLPDSFDKFQDLKYNDHKRWDALKAGKQDRINQMEFSEMGDLVGKLGDKETRLWYKTKDGGIADQIDPLLSLKEQAMQAHEMRNRYRTQARDLMADQKARKTLDEGHPNPTFEQLLERKEKKYGLVGDDAYRDIIRSSGTTNKKYDAIAGLKEGES